MYTNNNQTFLIDETRPADNIVDYRSVFTDEDVYGIKKIETTNSGLRRILDAENFVYTVIEERQLTPEEMLEVREEIKKRNEKFKLLQKEDGFTILPDSE